jgi:hypothetical protein
MKERLVIMMSISNEFKGMMLTMRLNYLCEKSKEIGKFIGDLPIIFFPKEQKELIEFAEEEYELAVELYSLYIDNAEFSRAALVLQSEESIEESLFFLKKPVYML